MATISVTDAKAIMRTIGSDIFNQAKQVIGYSELADAPAQIRLLSRNMRDFVSKLEQQRAPFYYFSRKTITVCEEIENSSNFNPSKIRLLADRILNCASLFLQLLSDRRNGLDEFLTPDLDERWERRDIPFIKYFLEIAGYSETIKEIVTVALAEGFFMGIAEPILLFHFHFLPPELKDKIEFLLRHPVLPFRSTNSSGADKGFYEVDEDPFWDEKNISREQILLSIVASLQDGKWDIAEVLIKTNLSKFYPEDLKEIEAYFTDKTPAVLWALVQGS